MSSDTPAKERIIQEYVPGKQVTLAHVIANPSEKLYAKIGLTVDSRGAVGVLTITPGEAAVIAADVASKSSAVELGFVDRFSGSVLIVGQLAAVESALAAVVAVLRDTLGFTPVEITRS